MAWTELQKTELIAAYLAAEPTAASSTEIIKDLAEKLEQSSNGVRMVLVQAGVYVKKTTEPAGKVASGEKSESKGTRVSKESSIAALTAAIVAKGGEIDEDILSKMTGKAAIYFTALFAL